MNIKELLTAIAALALVLVCRSASAGDPQPWGGCAALDTSCNGMSGSYYGATSNLNGYPSDSTYPYTPDLIDQYLFTPQGSADTTVRKKMVWIHGRSPDTNHCGVYRAHTNKTYAYRQADINGYWRGKAREHFMLAPFNSTFVGYHGDSDPRSWDGFHDGTAGDGSNSYRTRRAGGTCYYGAQSQLSYALWRDCTGSGEQNNCLIRCHSGGCYALDYYLGSLSSSDRQQLNLVEAWHAASAAGGSRLANVTPTGPSSEYFTPMVHALYVQHARAFARQGTLTGVMLAGNDPTASDSYWAQTFVNLNMRGRHDGAVNFGSTCGYSQWDSSDNNNIGFTSCGNSNPKYENKYSPTQLSWLNNPLLYGRSGSYVGGFYSSYGTDTQSFPFNHPNMEKLQSWLIVRTHGTKNYYDFANQ